MNQIYCLRYFSKITFYFVLLIQTSCASLSTVKPEEASLHDQDKQMLLEITKKGDKGELTNFINTHSQNIQFMDGLQYRSITGITLGEDSFSFGRAYVIITNDGVFKLDYRGDLKKISDSFSDYLNERTLNVLSCVKDENKDISTCLAAELTPYSVQDVVQSKILCSDESNEGCIYSKNGSEITLKLKSEVELSNRLPSFLPADIAKRFYTEVRKEIESRNQKIAASNFLNKEQEKKIEAVQAMYKKNQCDFFLEAEVVRKLDQSTYELAIGCFPAFNGQCIYGPISNARRDSDIARVQYKPMKKNSLKAGKIGYLDVAKVGRKKVHLKNGFDGSIEVFIESPKCKGIREANQRLHSQ